jgi:hypothetical protein
LPNKDSRTTQKVPAIGEAFERAVLMYPLRRFVRRFRVPAAATGTGEQGAA